MICCLSHHTAPFACCVLGSFGRTRFRVRAQFAWCFERKVRFVIFLLLTEITTPCRVRPWAMAFMSILLGVQRVPGGPEAWNTWYGVGAIVTFLVTLSINHIDLMHKIKVPKKKKLLLVFFCFIFFVFRSAVFRTNWAAKVSIHLLHKTSLWKKIDLPILPSTMLLWPSAASICSMKDILSWCKECDRSELVSL